jgi:protein-disulfide isomerase
MLASHDDDSAPRACRALAWQRAALAVCWLFIGTVACAAQPAGSEAAGADKVLATVGSRSITEAEVAEVVKSDLMRVDQERYELIARGLQGRIEQVMRELEAAEAGLGVDELVAREVDAKLDPVSDADVDAFYEQNRARINQPREEIGPRILEYLTQQKRGQAMATWMSALREKYAVTTLLEPIRMEVAAEGFPAKGPADAAVTIVEFSDFECPYCGRIVPTLQQVTEKYPNEVRFVFRQFPLNIHPNAQKAAEASLCANEQGKFWEMHDAMFTNQRALGVDQLKAAAATLGLDATAFNECLDSGRTAAAVAADLAAGSAAGVSGTPAMFVNGRFVSGAVPFEQLDAVIGEELKRAASAS